MNELVVFHDLRFGNHDPGDDHPESTKRMQAVEKALDPLRGRIPIEPGRLIEAKALERLHSPAYIRFVQESANRHRSALSSDTFASASTYETALLAAGTAQAAVEVVLQGTCRSSFALVRPPGHHAEFGRSMGYCVFNNTALAADHAVNRFGLERVLVIDWDVHHGNGTQHLFETDPRVLFFSVHQSPLFPGTGHLMEVGRGKAEGLTVNVPLPKGCTNDDYALVFDRMLTPIARTFRPQIILVSAGFDAHFRDPLGGMQVDGNGFAKMTRSIMTLAAEICNGRLVLILEGGYDIDALAESVSAVLMQLCRSEIPASTDSPNIPISKNFQKIWKRFCAVHGLYWKCFST
ncbi:MAG: histone deacetylase [Thermodesulfobacteriota bacterium]